MEKQQQQQKTNTKPKSKNKQKKRLIYYPLVDFISLSTYNKKLRSEAPKYFQAISAYIFIVMSIHDEKE